MRQSIANDDPRNHCFGCSPHNARGLQLTFAKTGPGRVECRYTAEEHLCGPDGVIHGGIQAALLDEVMGMAIRAGAEEDDLAIVTADFKLRYRRPAPVGVAVVVRAELTGGDERDFFARGEILTPDGECTTLAEARWRRIERPAAPAGRDDTGLPPSQPR